MLIERRHRRLAAAMVGVLALATGGQAMASVLFTTGPSQQVNGAGGLGPRDSSYAQIFTLDQAADLTGVLFGIAISSTASMQHIDWAILSDAQRNGGTVLYSGSATEFDQTDPVGSLYPPHVYRDVTFATPASYLASGTYWLRLHVATNTSSSVYWDIVGAVPGSGELVYEGDLYARDERTAFTLYGEFTEAGAVPEPATWAMMIVGFGLTGGMLRQRRTSIGART